MALKAEALARQTLALQPDIMVIACTRLTTPFHVPPAASLSYLDEAVELESQNHSPFVCGEVWSGSAHKLLHHLHPE